MTTTPPHIPVLLDGVLAALQPRPGQVIVDATFGAGGYTRAILDAGATVVALDRDPTAITAGRDLELASNGRLRLVETRFSGLKQALAEQDITAVDGVVFDLGVSSMQLDRAERGFSFRRDGPLDMRMGGEGASAADLVNTASERALADILYRYGDERRSRAIAAAVVGRRKAEPFSRTSDLAALVEQVLGRNPKDASHPATRTFQALRIAVNQELEEVADGLSGAEEVLREGGRLVVVTFHSLEDRLVKSFLSERSKPPAVSRHAPATAMRAPSFTLLGRKPVEPTPAEIGANPRSRSAKLRAAVRTGAAPLPLDPEALGVVALADLMRGGRR